MIQDNTLSIDFMLYRYTTHPKFLPHPARHVSLRGASDEEYCVVDVTRVGKPGGVARILEQMELSRALFELYEGAVVIFFFFMYLNLC